MGEGSVTGGNLGAWNFISLPEKTGENGGCNEMMWAEMRCGGALQRDEMFNDRHIASDNRRGMFRQKEGKKRRRSRVGQWSSGDGKSVGGAREDKG